MRTRKQNRWRLTVKQTGHFIVAELRILGGPRPKRWVYRVDLRAVKARIVRALRKQGVSGDAIGFSLRKLWRKTKNTVKKVASSKVWAAAEKATAAASALPPPYGPALAGVNAGMKTTRALVVAKKRLASGDKEGAIRLTRAAKKVAARHRVGIPTEAAQRMYLALVA